MRFEDEVDFLILLLVFFANFWKVQNLFHFVELPEASACN